MKTELYIKYTGSDSRDDSNIPLSDLGKSLISFERIVNDLSEIFGIDAKVEVLATTHREGSHIVDLLLQISDAFDSLPFDSPEHFLEFLKFANEEAWRHASEFLTDLKEIHRTVNDYCAKYPADLALLALLIPGLFALVRKQRKTPVPVDPNMSDRIAKQVYKLIEKNKFGQFVKPIAEESATSIDISSDKNFRKNTTRIDTNNFEEYMGKDSEILPEFINGDERSIAGSITSLKSTRGDSLTFHFKTSEKTYNLDLFPEADKTTKNYVKFYLEEVNLTARVERTSLFKKPKLHLINIELLQQELDIEK
jgi:hypothetical protein